MRSTFTCVVASVLAACLMTGCPSKERSEEETVGETRELVRDVLQKTLDRHQKNICKANLVRIMIGIKTYASEHEGRFPETLGGLYRSLPGEDKNLDMFVCPGTRHEPGNPDNIDEWSDYVYVGGQRWAEEGETPILILYDKTGNHPDGRHVRYNNGFFGWEPNPSSGLRRFPAELQRQIGDYQGVLEVDVKVPPQGDFWLPGEYQRMLEEKIREMQEKEGT